MTLPAAPYVGRFAPSPTGHLHLGTLAAAAASYLHARQAGGQWLVRIEDIDPPREVAGSAESILRTLEALELHWDREVRYQGSRMSSYLAVASELFARDAAFYCRCSRQEIRDLTGNDRYPGTCRERRLSAGDAALRFRVTDDETSFVDGLRGRISRRVAEADGDFVILRRDGLPAYHLAVVVDDADQGVSDIVRGSDLLDSTPLHICLQRRLGLPTPRYWHIPVVTNTGGEKLSKGAGAAAIGGAHPSDDAFRVLRLLGLNTPQELAGAPPRELWQWAENHWRIDKLAGSNAVIATEA